MNPVESVKTCFRKSLDFSGRASRSEYWWFYLFVIVLYIPLITLVLAFLGSLLFPGLGPAELGEQVGLFFVIIGLVALLPLLAVQVRRLHDVGGNAWYLLLHLLYGIGPVALLIMCALKGKDETNKYGDPII